ncbi:LCI family antimicrobial peptide [Photorhabdus tasmaniensis]
MFKKLLTVGALTTALIGGIGTVSAADFQYTGCDTSEGSTFYDQSGAIYTNYLVYPNNIFANVYKDGRIKWYFKGSKPLGTHCNKPGYYVAYYEGRQI